MNKYKVEIKESIIYCVDVLAKDEAEAKEKATSKFREYCDYGTYHYHETGQDSEISAVYDVTNTDDPFDPE